MSSFEIGLVARSMLDGSVNYFVGAEQLVHIRDELGVYANDPDFVVFIAVLSEIEYLRDGDGNFDWFRLSDVKYEQRLEESMRWAKEISLDNCKSLARRYTEQS